MIGQLAYTPSSRDTAWSRRKIATALPPMERVLFPADLAMLVDRCDSIMADQRLDETVLASRTGLDGRTVHRFMTNGDVTVDEAMRITSALGCRLARIPAGLRRR